MNLYKNQGFGSIPMAYSTREGENSREYHNISVIEDEVKDVIGEATVIAKKELIKERKLLLKFAEIERISARIEKDEIKELIKEYSDILISDVPDNFFRNTLFAQIETKHIFNEISSQSPVVLNRDK